MNDRVPTRPTTTDRTTPSRRGRASARSLLLAAVVLIAPSAAHASAAASPVLGSPPHPAVDERIVHRLVFQVDLTTFMQLADTRLHGDRWLDWTTDWCSAPLVGSTGRSFDFRSACRRHDFAYRNVKLLDVRYGCDERPADDVCDRRAWRHGRWWNAATRAAIDRRFRSDMHRSCNGRGFGQRPPCLMWSEVFYRAVRIAGGP